MRKILILSLLMGCSLFEAKSTKLTEPDRTSFYAQCLMAGLSVTTCECYETTVVKKTGIVKVVTVADAAAITTIVSDITRSEECTKKEEDKKEE